MGEKGISVSVAVVIAVIVTAVIVGPVVYYATPKEAPPTGEVTRADVESFLNEASSSVVKDIVETCVSMDILRELVPGPEKVKFGCMWMSPAAATCWCSATQMAIDKMEARYPDVLEKSVIMEEVAPEDTNTFAKSMIADGADIIIANAEYMAMPLADIYEDYPDVYFMGNIAGDISSGRNWIRYFSKEYQAVYLAGIVAGALTETNNIGMIGSFKCAQVCRRINAFALGIQEVNPDATLYVLWVGDWYVPTKEMEVAETLIDTYDVDVMTQQTDSPSGSTVAAERGIWFIGKDTDYIAAGWGTGATIATSFALRWDVIWEMVLKDYMVGNDYPRNLYFIGMEEPLYVEEGRVLSVDLISNGISGVDSISSEAEAAIKAKSTALWNQVADLVETKREAIIGGMWDPFMKEIKDTEGKVWYPEGVMPTDEALLTEDYLVEGVVAPAA